MSNNTDKPDGFYFVYSLNEKGEKQEVCLVKLYSIEHDDVQYRGIGFGIWDGCGFVSLDDLDEETILEPLTDDKGFIKSDLLSLTMVK